MHIAPGCVEHSLDFAPTVLLHLTPAKKQINQQHGVGHASINNLINACPSHRESEAAGIPFTSINT